MTCEIRPTLCKTAAEERVFTLDFRLPLKDAGTTISSIDSIDDTPSGDLTISGSTISADGLSIQFRVAGGSDGQDYNIDVLVTCVDTQKLEGEVALKVRD